VRAAGALGSFTGAWSAATSLHSEIDDNDVAAA